MIRTVSRNQHAAYAEGSLRLGFFIYKVQGIEREGVTTRYFDLQGERATFQAGDPAKAREARNTAVKNAWAAARAWVSENGTLERTDAELRSVAP